MSSRYRLRVAVLENELDAETTREKPDAFLNIIGRYVTEYQESHPGHQQSQS